MRDTTLQCAGDGDRPRKHIGQWYERRVKEVTDRGSCKEWLPQECSRQSDNGHDDDPSGGTVDGPEILRQGTVGR